MVGMASDEGRMGRMRIMVSKRDLYDDQFPFVVKVCNAGNCHDVSENIFRVDIFPYLEQYPICGYAHNLAPVLCSVFMLHVIEASDVNIWDT